MKHRIIVVIVLLGLLALSTGCQADPACAGRPERQVPATAEAAGSLRQKVEGATGSSGPFRVQVTEQEVTSYVALELQGSPISEATFWFTPDKAYLDGKFDLRGMHRLEGALTLQVQEGKLRIVLLCGSLDGAPLPKAVLATVQAALNQELAKYADRIAWDEATIGEGVLELAGQGQ